MTQELSSQVSCSKSVKAMERLRYARIQLLFYLFVKFRMD